MKKCENCSFAQWKKTATGKLHPSGDGLCTYKYRMPALPASMYWVNQPKQCGGFINRHAELKEHCTYYNGGLK